MFVDMKMRDLLFGRALPWLGQVVCRLASVPSACVCMVFLCACFVASVMFSTDSHAE